MRRELQKGIFLDIVHDALLTLVANAGYDFVLLDMEHGLMSRKEIARAIAVAKSVDLRVLIRISRDDLPGGGARYLDAGADGLVLAHARGSKDARELVECAMYPPIGRRGYNPSIAAAISRNGVGAVSDANRSMHLYLIIESMQGIRNAHEMMTVPDIRGFLIGWGDLSFWRDLMEGIDNVDIGEIRDLSRLLSASSEKNYMGFKATSNDLFEECSHAEYQLDVELYGPISRIVARGLLGELE